jgi:hypothetical protein
MRSTLGRSLACSLLLAFSAPAWSFSLDQLQTLSQAEFRLLAEDVGAALSYHPQTPTEPLGLFGFDIGVAITGSTIKNKDALDKATSGTVPSYLPVPALRGNLGLPFGFDVGLMYSAVPDSNISLQGGELRWAFLKGGIGEPALGVRAAATRLAGVEQADLTTKSVDLSASKGFGPITPYVGVGRTWISAEPHVGGLVKEEFTLDKFFVGAGFKLLVFNLNAEVDRTGVSNAYSLKAGIRF